MFQDGEFACCGIARNYSLPGGTSGKIEAQSLRSAVKCDFFQRSSLRWRQDLEDQKSLNSEAICVVKCAGVTFVRCRVRYCLKDRRSSDGQAIMTTPVLTPT